MNTRSFRLTPWVVSVAFWAAAITPSFAENSWTKTTSGNWEEPFWSAGHLPTFSDGAILFTNAGWKALAIGSVTASNYPNSLRLGSLTVEAPVDSRNTLLLNWAGLSVPLHPDTLTIGTNASLLSHSSAIEAGTFTMNGQATFVDFGQSTFGTVDVGPYGTAELNLSNGWFSAEALVVARGVVQGAPSKFNQFGGSNQVSGRVSIDTEGTYNLSGGNFKATFIDLSPTTTRGRPWGRPPDTVNAPRLIVTGGRTEVQRQLTLGGFVDSDWHPGLMELSGGFFKGGDIVVKQGQVTHTAGTNQLNELSLSPAEYDSVNYVINGGRLESARVFLGYPSWPLAFSTPGVFTQSSGVHSNSESIKAWGLYIGPENQAYAGRYNLAGGTLFSPAIALDGGKLSQSGGTNYARQLWLTNGGRYELSGGTLISSNTWIDSYPNQYVRSRFIQTGGEHRVQRMLWLENGGVYDLQAGVLSTYMISINGGTQLRLKGIVSSNSSLELHNGTVFFDGNYSLGHLLFNGTGHIDFQSGSSIVHFTGVGYPPPALDGDLVIHNWKGSAQSPGRDQFYIDGTDPYIRYRIQSMTFVDPAGYPPGHYRARRKASGEIVPLNPPIITCTRSASTNAMVLTWPDGYQLLSSDKITGPFEPVPNATSPISVSFTDSQRFFVLRPTQ